MVFSRRALTVGLSLALAAGAVPAFAQMSSSMGSMNNQHTVMVGGAAMYPSRNIVQNAMHSKDHTTLVKAVKAAGLVKTLEGPGPFTVFAPTNEAFEALPAGTLQNLMKPDNEAMLKKILTYHVVPGRLDSKALDAKIAAGGGEAKLKTVEGDWLTVKGSGTHLTVTDDQGNTADVTIPNVYQSNGVIMVINKVLMP
ncbi:MAG: fasciclin domain-containing protein [Rhodanobacteraceae bacterium]